MAENKRALIVDDEQFILKIISDILTKEGYEVKTACNCDKALKFLKEGCFHVVLTDIRMPEKNGIDLLEKMQDCNSDVPVILMTGFASLETAVAAVKHGAFDYLIKPLDYDKLKSIINNAVEKYELVQENGRLLARLQELNTMLEFKVRERTRELENTLNSAHESIITTDKELVIRSANPKTASIFGKDSVGQKLSDLVPDINFHSTLPQILTDPSYAVEHKVNYGDKFLEIRLSPLVDFETGEIFGVMVVAEDITEKKKLEAQLIQSAKMSAVGQLAAGVAHEFNNILTGILGYTSFALSRASIGRIKTDLKVIEKASDRAVEIVKKLLSFSKQGEGEFQLAKIEEAIEDALVLMERTLKSDEIKIVRRYEKISPIRMNVGEIQQIVLNVLMNSRHAMPGGGVVTISTELENDYVRIDFSDTGLGISEENLPRIFEPFFTTKTSRGGDSTSGTGLGLYVVYAIVEKHGGRTEVKSEVGKGTTLTIWLPNVPTLSKADLSESDPGKQNVEGENKVSQPRREANVLVVDNEKIICDIIKETLSSDGHKVLAANSGESAVELMRGNHFDIIFLDLTMPGKSGLDVLREIRTLDPISVVVIISGRIQENVVNQLIAEGAFSFVHKPFTPDQIQNTVASILENQ